MAFHTQRENCNNIKRETGHHTLGEKTLIKQFKIKEKPRKRPILPSFEEGTKKAIMILERYLL